MVPVDLWVPFLQPGHSQDYSWFAKLEYHKSDGVRVILKGEDGLSFPTNGSFLILGSIYIVGDDGFG